MLNVTLLALDVLAGALTFFVSREVMTWLINRKKEVLVSSSTSANEEKVLEAIRNGAKTLNEIMKYTGLPKSTAYKALKRLLKEGKVEKVVNGGNVRYVEKVKSEKD
ncbi:MAG: winged helix-turn-helix domain-containing protein [Candidatus Aramenus sp.]|nr:winged helix-turn-helix domain-containing protein [Candidatus Aramenus sp.]